MTKLSTVRFGVIGTNTITEKMIRGGSQDERFLLTGVTSRDGAKAQEFAVRHGIPYVFPSLEDMAASDLINAVYIATPNALHAAQAIKCMERGKHVLCEKAIASNAGELRLMIEAARRNDVTLMEAMKPLTTPNFKVVLETLPKLGKIRRYFSSYCQYSSRYNNLKNGIIENAFRPELSNGALLDIGIYTIYPMVVMFGRPRGIKAQGSLLSTGVDAQGSVMFDYGDMEASVVYSKVAQSALPTEIQGEEGNLTLDRIGQIGKATLTKPLSAEPQDISAPSPYDDFCYEVGHFIDLVLKGGHNQSAINSLENSLAVMEIMDEIRAQIGVRYPADLI